MSVAESGSTVPESNWVKSSCSSGEGGECVEVATCPATVRVRDSKDKAGPVLAFDLDAWRAFVGFAAGLDV